MTSGERMETESEMDICPCSHRISNSISISWNGSARSLSLSEYASSRNQRPDSSRKTSNVFSIGNKDVLAQLDFRLIENHPTSRTSPAPVTVWRDYFGAQV